MSSVSASDDVSDVITTDDAQVDDLASDIEQDLEQTVEETADETIGGDAVDTEKLSASEDESKLTVDESKDKLSMIFGNYYKIDLSDTTIASDKSQKVYAHITPSKVAGSYGYDFDFVVYDRNSKLVYTKHYSSTTTTENTYSMTIAKNTLAPGTYVMAAVNTYDSVLMDAAYLLVSGNAVITGDNYVAQYMSGAKMSAKVTDQVTGNPLTSVTVKVLFTKGKKSVTKYYSTNANGEISFVPPVGVGTWTVTYSVSDPQVIGSAVRTATVQKSAVKIKAKNIVEYKGFKTTIKVTVTSHGKKVNEGIVVLKINGKKYNVKVKNGVATKKIKLKKVKKYKYTAVYKGNANLKKSKYAKAKVTLKNRVKVRIIVKNQAVYAGQSKVITIKIKDSRGKYVKSGTLKVQNKYGKYEKVKVTNGKVKVLVYGTLSDVYKGTNGITTYYKKSVSKTFKIKYVTATHKYKSATKKWRGTTKFKCDMCGKTSTHYHYSYGYFVVYKYKIQVS